MELCPVGIETVLEPSDQLFTVLTEGCCPVGLVPRRPHPGPEGLLPTLPEVRSCRTPGDTGSLATEEGTQYSHWLGKSFGTRVTATAQSRPSFPLLSSTVNYSVETQLSLV